MSVDTVRLSPQVPVTVPPIGVGTYSTIAPVTAHTLHQADTFSKTPPPPLVALRNLDTSAVFHATDFVSEEEIEGLLRGNGAPTLQDVASFIQSARFQRSSYRSVTQPQVEHFLQEKGWPQNRDALLYSGEEILNASREFGVNPLMLLAIMQIESSYGNLKRNPKLDIENLFNPYSVHFTHRPVGLRMLRKTDKATGQATLLPTFQESVNAAARTAKRWGDATELDPKHPFTSLGKKYSVRSEYWTGHVKEFYLNLLDEVARFRRMMN